MNVTAHDSMTIERKFEDSLSLLESIWVDRMDPTNYTDQNPAHLHGAPTNTVNKYTLLQKRVH
jgi:hypothetical protein